MAPPPPSSRTRSSTTPSRIARLGPALFYCVFQLAVFGSVASKIDGGWDTAPNTQYHVQTDEGPERYFKYQTISGQYRKERRLQDGTVVGTYGWVDADGYLRLNDYVADSKGYRIVKNKKLYVGTQTPVGQAVSEAKYAAPAAVDAVTTPAPAVHSSWRGSPFVYPSDSQSAPLLFPSSTAAPQSRRPPASRYRGAPAQGRHQPAYRPVRPADVNSIAAADDGGGDGSAYRRQSAPSSTPAPEPLRPHTFRPAYRKVVDDGAPAGYDGVSFVRNGFRYYLPRHYHEERTDGDGSRTGSFGYVDPFGIRRVVYYDSAPGAGFAHRKNNRYVGLDAEPYDPRPMSA